MLSKALIYRAGSVVIGLALNYYFFGTIEMALWVGFVFTVVLTAYYVAFHHFWPGK